jgi:chemotaxis protein CheX
MSEEQETTPAESPLQIEEASGCKIIHCPVDIEDELISQLMLRLNVLMDEASSLHIVLDLEKKSQIDYKFYRSAATLASKLKKAGKKIHVIHSPDETLSRTIREQGMDSILKVHATLNDVLRDTAPAPAAPTKGNSVQADVVFLNAFIDASVKTMGVQCSIEAKPGRASLISKAPEMVYDIVGLIGLASKAFQGSIAICYPQDTFLKILGSMLGETYTEITQDLEDGAAELMNIIFGQAKIDLNQKGYEIEKAIPTVIRARDLKLRSVSHAATLVIPFETPAGPFRIEISIDRQGS